LIFSSALSPQIARLHAAGLRHELSEVLSATARWTSAVAIPVILAVAILRNDLMWVVNSSYADLDATFILLLLPIPFLKCSVGMAGNVVVMTGRPRLNLMNGLTEGILNVILNLWLIPKYGLMGAAVASSIAAVARATLEVVEIYRLVGVRFIPVIVLGPYAAAILAAGFAVVAAIWTEAYSTLGGRLLVTLGTSAVFMLLVYLTRQPGDSSVASGVGST
jgi:O-antigen/teichoic acid export membrane protein